MKVLRRKLPVLLAVAAVAGTVQSCKKGCTDPLATNYDAKAKKDDPDEPCVYSNNDAFTRTTNGTTVTISGRTLVDDTFSSDTTYVLSGGVFVDAGATLHIDAGTTILAADDGTVPFLSIQRGGMIDACATASNPIVFTSQKAAPAPGDWGGIIVNGYATINTGLEAEGEGGTGLYGGTDDSDNSGSICYVRVEYAGKLLSTDNELNGFSFNGVGSGTTVNHIQAYMGADDGIEFFGGTVSVEYAVSSGNQDDSFDWTHGWRGNGQFWVVEQAATGGDRGIEADNNGDNNGVTPFSNPTLSNLTLIGMEDGDSSNTGMRLREGTKGQIYNAIVMNFPKNGIRVSDSITTVNMNAGELHVQSSISFNNGTDWKDCAPFEPANENTNDDSNDPMLNGYVGTVTSGNEFDPTSIGLRAGNFIGAVQSGNNWTTGWTRAL